MVQYELDDEKDAQITIKLFRNVKNMPEVRKKVMDNVIQCGIVKPKLIVDPFQIVVAANKTICSTNLITKSIYTDMLFNLSISKNISQSLLQFGVHDEDTDILIVVFNDKDGSFDYKGLIDGEEHELSQLNQLTDVALIKKTYKIKEEESKSVNLIDSVVSRIASKDFIKF